MSKIAKAVAVRVVRWRRTAIEFGVTVDCEDGHRVVYKAGTRGAARRDAAKIKVDPELAARLRIDRLRGSDE